MPLMLICPCLDQYTLAAPTQIWYEAGRLAWNQVDCAVGYKVELLQLEEDYYYTYAEPEESIVYEARIQTKKYSLVNSKILGESSMVSRKR